MSITVSSTIGLQREIIAVKETESNATQVEVIDHTMLPLHQDQCLNEVMLEEDPIIQVQIMEKNHQAVTTTGANTLRFVLTHQQIGQEVVAQHLLVLIGTFVEEVVNMEAQDHQAVQGHPKVVIVAAATTITEATGTELF